MIKINKDWKYKETLPKVSAYTTVYNCISGSYPFEKSIKSFGWADELVVVDGGSDDGTREKLEELTKEYPNFSVYDIPIDWDNPGKDGAQKAMARAMCSSEFLVQFDADEICMGDSDDWRRLAKNMPDNFDILNLLVIEPFGGLTRVRVNESHNPSKWRIYRNKPEITHGIPAGDRLEVDDKVYSRGGSDGCFPVHIVNNQLYPSYTPSYLSEILTLKRGLPEEYDKDMPDEETLSYKYSQLIGSTLNSQPCVLHLGHLHLKEKIMNYLTNWHNWWCHLYNKDPDDPTNNLYFPGETPEEVLKAEEEKVQQKVDELVKETPVVGVYELEYFEDEYQNRTE